MGFLTLDAQPPAANGPKPESGGGMPRVEPRGMLGVDELLKRLVAHPAALSRLDPPVDLRFGVRQLPDPADYDESDPVLSLQSTQLLAGAAIGGRAEEGTSELEIRAKRITFVILVLVFTVACCWQVCASVVESIRDACGLGSGGGQKPSSRASSTASRHSSAHLLGAHRDLFDDDDDDDGGGGVSDVMTDPRVDVAGYRRESKDVDCADDSWERDQRWSIDSEGHAPPREGTRYGHGIELSVE